MKFIIFSALVTAVVAAPDALYQAEYVPIHINISSDSSLRIVDGQGAARNQFPYQISLQLRQVTFWSHICGGSIISPSYYDQEYQTTYYDLKWILTAAHCTHSYSPLQLRIVAGILLLSDVNVAGQQIRGVQRIINHPLYPGGNQVAPNDVSLIQLVSTLQYTINVQPIGIPIQGTISRGVGVLSGWGLLRTGGSTPNQLQYAVKPVIPEPECHYLLMSILNSRNVQFNEQLNMCSGNANKLQSACQGDSGGPFVQDGKVIGVVSWVVTPCGTRGAPSVYVKTSAFSNWISTNTNGEVRPVN